MNYLPYRSIPKKKKKIQESVLLCGITMQLDKLSKYYFSIAPTQTLTLHVQEYLLLQIQPIYLSVVF